MGGGTRLCRAQVWGTNKGGIGEEQQALLQTPVGCRAIYTCGWQTDELAACPRQVWAQSQGRLLGVQQLLFAGFAGCTGEGRVGGCRGGVGSRGPLPAEGWCRCRERGCRAGVCTCTGCPGPMERLLGGGLRCPANTSCSLQSLASPRSPSHSPADLPRLLHSLRRAAWARRARTQPPMPQAADSCWPGHVRLGVPQRPGWH